MTELKSYADGGAGHYGSDTAIAGALHIQDKLPQLQRQVLDVIEESRASGVNNDRIARRLGWDKYRTRPRLSELRNAGLIVDSGRREKGESGISQIVWLAAKFLSEPQGGAHG